jgi:hypothetical protein
VEAEEAAGDGEGDVVEDFEPSEEEGALLLMASTVNNASPPATPSASPDQGMSSVDSASGTTTSNETWLVVNSPLWTRTASIPTGLPSGQATDMDSKVDPPGTIASTSATPRISPEDTKRTVTGSDGAVPVLLTSTVNAVDPPATGSTGTVVDWSRSAKEADAGWTVAVTSKGPPS